MAAVPALDNGRGDPPTPGYAAQLGRELRRAVAGEVTFGPERAMYAYDASIFRQVPIGVVCPRDADDVEAALAVCRRFEAPVLGRGCGTGLAGQSVNAAVVFDFTRHMDAILEVDPQRCTARVQPGVICDSLRSAAGEYGLTFGPDPATHDHATLGGMIGNNSCGAHSVATGKTVDNIEDLEVLTYDGTRMTVGATTDRQWEDIVAAGGRRGEIYAGMRRLRDRYSDTIRDGLPRIPRRVSGYNLDSLLPEGGFHVARALVGSESTLALTLEATCRLVRLPPHRSLVVLGYPGISSSGDDVPWLMDFEPVALEFTSRHVVDNLHAKNFHFGGEDLLPEGTAWLLMEFGGESKREADAQAEQLVNALKRRGGRVPSYRLYEKPQDETAVWEIRRHSAGTARMPVGLGGHTGWPNWEDAAVAPEHLGEYLRGFTALLDRFGYDGVFYGHWGQGCVHCRIDFDLRTAPGIAKYRGFMEDAADLVASFGGSLSGEHGDGHGRAELWPRMFPPELMDAFTEFKQLWDPQGRMNPHKLIDPYPLDTHLREGTDYRPVPVETVFAFPGDGGDFNSAAGRCFGVGKCRHLDGGVMCPSFMVTREEKHSTRGRARLLQEMAESAGPVQGRWRSREVKEALDLCLACKGCRSDCPVNVDMATYKAEFLHHHYAGRLRPRAAYALGLVNVWARWGSRVPGLSNTLTHAPVVSALLKRAAGIAPKRTAPRLARTTFTALYSTRTPRNPDGPKVMLWPDTFTNYFEPHVGVAALEVLEAAGFRVVLPEASVCCGRPLYDYGMLDLARRYLRRTLEQVRPALAEGMPIVGLEPSCVAVFRDELTNLFPHDPDAQRLSEQAMVLSEFLDGHTDWPVPRLRRAALVQPHCHHHAVLGFDAERRILDAMGLDVEVPDAGCCGLAGSFGYEAGERYEVSMAAGERVLLPAVREAPADTLIIADGFSCRSQISSGTGRKALHLAEVLALAVHEGELGEPPDGRGITELEDSGSRDGHHRRAKLALAAAGTAAGALAAARIAAHHR